MASSAPTPLHPMDGGPSEASSPQSATPARAAVDVVALTSRDDFLLELGASLGGQASINPVESPEQALEQLSDARRPQVLIIDGRDVEDVVAVVETIQTQAPRASILVFAGEGADPSLADALRPHDIVGVLPLPVESSSTPALFAEAVAVAKAKQAQQPAATSEVHSVALPQMNAIDAPLAAPSAPRAQPPGGGRSHSMQIVLGGVALVIIAGGLIAYFSKDPVPAPRAAEEQPVDADVIAQVALPAVETSIVKGKVDELLEKARLAMRERRYAEPAGDNALLYYRSAIATDASSAEALDGLNRVASVLAGRIEESLDGGQLEEAATALAQFKNAMPEDLRVAQFQQRLTGTQVSKAIADGNLDRAAALVRAAQQNNLLPAPQVTRWRAEISRLQKEAREKRAADAAAREAAAEQKKVLAARAAAAAEAERQAEVARDRQREEQLKSEQAAQAVRESSAPASSSSPQLAAVRQSSLKRKRYTAPEYPPDALARQIGGVVQVAFTVDAQGETRDISVVSAEPKGVFDRAAVAAVKRWRYEPPLIDGAATEVPVRMQIRFAPEK